MAPLTFADTHNMVAYLSKSNASVGFDQIVDFLNARMIQYALVVNLTIYVSCIKQFWVSATIKKVNDAVQLRALIDRKKVWKFLIHTLVECISAKRTAWNEFSCSMASAVICLATGRKFNFSKYIFDSMVRNVDSPSKFFMYPRFIQVIINAQVDDLTSYNTKYSSPSLTRKVAEEEDEVEVPIALAPPSPTSAPSPPPHEPIPTPPQVQPATPHALPTQEQPTETSESSIPLLNNLLETYAALSQKVTELEQDKHTQALEIIKLEKRVKKLERKRNQNMETQVDMDAEFQGKIDQDMAQKLHDEEVKKAAAREKHEKDDLERAQMLQQQYDNKEENIEWNAVAKQIQEKHLDNSRKYQSLKRKPVSIAQAGKNMIIYLKNMARYKIEHFRVKEKFSSAVPNVDKEKALWVELKRFFEPDADDVIWKLQRHAMFMLTKKDYPLSNGVMTLMLSAKLQVKEDSDMARDLVMKIFMDPNKPKSRSLDTSSK
nr:synaptobrevin, longin-like domain protein [Tanacetum cinerariifolium]